MAGNKASATVQPFLLLHLDIHPEAVHTIEDALHLFSAPEFLEGYRASTAGKVVVSFDCFLLAIGHYIYLYRSYTLGVCVCIVCLIFSLTFRCY